jgi:phosphatidylinositol glycan class S
MSNGYSTGMPSPSNAFLLPQWGGIVLFNPAPETHTHTSLSSSSLDAIFTAFSNQLLALLGVPLLPTHIPSTELMTGWQFDALIRRRILENTKSSQDTLKSIVRLVDQIGNMPVGAHVKGDVLGALDALDKVPFLSTSFFWSVVNHIYSL